MFKVSFIMPKLLRFFLWIIIFLYFDSTLEKETILKLYYY